MWKAKWAYWVVQILGWGSFYSLIAYVETTGDVQKGLPKEIPHLLFIRWTTVLLVSIGVTHFWRYLMLRFKMLDLNFTRILIPLTFSLIFVSILGSLITSIIDFDEITGKYNPNLSIDFFARKVFINSFLNGIWVLFYLPYCLYEKTRTQELDNLRLIAHQREMELKNLQSQLNPHFLFNALNSIRALVDFDPEKAREAITSLSIIMRKSLELGKIQLVSLSDEMTLVENYLELEQIRFEERLRIKYEIDDRLLDIKIPPFMIQTLTENAVKHGISKLMDGGDLIIKIFTLHDESIISIYNTGKLGNETDSGIGIKNVEQRLQFAFGEKATFELTENEGVEARITIKI
jgi:two-component system, LytTR family, sensor kinase